MYEFAVLPTTSGPLLAVSPTYCSQRSSRCHILALVSGSLSPRSLQSTVSAVFLPCFHYTIFNYGGKRLKIGLVQNPVWDPVAPPPGHVGVVVVTPCEGIAVSRMGVSTGSTYQETADVNVVHIRECDFVASFI